MAHDTETTTGHHLTIISLPLLIYFSTHHTGLISIMPYWHQQTCYHIYGNTEITPSWHHALEQYTDTHSVIPGHWRPLFSYISGLLHIPSLTSGFAVSHGYYREISPITVDPDWDQDHCLLHCLCTALSYGKPFAQILVIQSHVRHCIRTAVANTIIGPFILASRIIVFSRRKFA
jgi:hypothetical protein